MRLPALALTLVLASACNCGDDPASGDPGPRPGSACQRQSDCGSDLLCFERTCVESLAAAPGCATPGASPALVAGAPIEAPEVPAGTCSFGVRPLTFEAGSGLGQVQALPGPATVGDVLQFTVPPGTWSITIFEQAVEGTAPATITYRGTPIPNSAVPTDVKRPDGTVFFTDTPATVPRDGEYDDWTGFVGVHFGSYAPFVGTATFPNASRGLELARVAGELPAGTWSLVVNDWAFECHEYFAADCPDGSATSQYEVHVVTRGPPRGTGRLDLDVYLATSDALDAPRITAEQAVNHAGVKRMFDTAAEYLGRGGLCLGTVTFHDLPDWARLRFDTVDYDETSSCDETAQLFRLSLASTTNVHLFAVDEIVNVNAQAGNELLLGLDGAIPGPSGLPGSPASGAITPLGDLQACPGGINLETCEADLRGYVAAHEIGHWLGLFHTTEAQGSFFDPLSDTGTCPCNRCSSGCSSASARVLATQCKVSATCSGGDNLLFWVIQGNASSGRLTSQQGEVMRSNPAVNLE